MPQESQHVPTSSPEPSQTRLNSGERLPVEPMMLIDVFMTDQLADWRKELSTTPTNRSRLMTGLPFTWPLKHYRQRNVKCLV